MTLSDWIGLIGLLVSIFGFTLAIVQLRRTANATEATAEKIEQTLDRLSVNHILVLLPQLRLIENDLDHAAEYDDRRLAQRALISYAHTAGQVASLMEKRTEADTAFLERLRTSARDASAAKSQLVSTKVTIKAATRDVAAEISAIAGLSAGLVAQYQSKVA